MNFQKAGFKDDTTKYWFIVGIVVFFILPVAAVFVLRNAELILNRENNCFVFRHFHIFCPGCGGTRAFAALLKGQILNSILYNPVVLTGLVSYFFFMINTCICLFTQKWGFRRFPITIVVFLNLGLMLLQCIIRNILYLGFSVTCL